MLGACGDDDDGGGGGGDDVIVDAAPNQPDAQTTACGSDACDVADEICVNDTNMQNSCQSIPIGCDEARTSYAVARPQRPSSPTAVNATDAAVTRRSETRAGRMASNTGADMLFMT